MYSTGTRAGVFHSDDWDDNTGLISIGSRGVHYSDYHTDPADASSWVVSNKNYVLGIRADSKVPTMGGVFCEGNGHADPHVYLGSRWLSVREPMFIVVLFGSSMLLTNIPGSTKFVTESFQ